MHIIEIYKSLQGESSFAGLPCVFVRLAGCNLRCAWCDSEYTFSGGHKMSEDEILAEVQRLSPGGGLVEITGGEPMLQDRELIPFCTSFSPWATNCCWKPAASVPSNSSRARSTKLSMSSVPAAASICASARRTSPPSPRAMS